MNAFKKYSHCGDNYYVGVKSQASPVCGECGENLENSFEQVEVYDGRLDYETQPVKTFETVEQYHEQ